MFQASNCHQSVLMTSAGVVVGLFSDDCPFCDRFSAGVGSFFLFFLLFPFLKVLCVFMGVLLLP